MANTLTNLIPTLYNALDVVSRELVGFIPAVTMDATHERAAVNQTVRSFVTPAAAADDHAPGVTAPDDGDQTIGNVSMTIQKSRYVPIRWNGEEQLSVSSPGIGAERILQDQFAQAMRTLCNEIERDIGALYTNASRAVGTAGTNPFVVSSAKVVDNAADALQILLDNGAPIGDLNMVINTSAGAGMRKVPNLVKVNEAGDVSLLRQGILGNLHGFNVRESAGVRTHTSGAATGRLVANVANYAVGDTSIAFDTGSGDFLAGDVVSFADAAGQYVVQATAATPLVLNATGLIDAVLNDKAITVAANYAANMAFARSALALATRAPALPGGGDMADDRTVVQDPRSGLAFEVAVYRQYRQVRYEVSIAWGVAAIKTDHIALMMG